VAVVTIVGDSVAVAELAGVGVGGGVEATLGAGVPDAGWSVGGTCAPDTGRATASCMSGAPACNSMGSADPDRFHSAAAASTTGMARPVASRSRSRTRFYSLRMRPETGRGDWAEPALTLMAIGLVTFARQFQRRRCTLR
jgi:hypothetical protein